jgi:hypothetical protein
LRSGTRDIALRLVGIGKPKAVITVVYIDHNSITKSLNISSPILDYIMIQSHISKSSYTPKQRKEFLRTWTAIGRAYVSASYSPDLLRLLDIASSNLVADHGWDDRRPLYTSHPLPAGSALCIPNSTAIISASIPPVTSISLVSSSDLCRKRQAGSDCWYHRVILHAVEGMVTCCVC